MREDKAQITKKLEELLNLTRMGKVELEYVSPGKVYSEEVQIRGIDEEGTIYYHGAANVSMDSGVALIRDVMKHPYFN
jgi:hypothetical protein